MEREGTVHLTEQGRALFGAAFLHVVSTLASVHSARRDPQGSLIGSIVPARAVPTSFKLHWAKSRGEIHFFHCRSGTESLLWTLSDLVDPVDLVSTLKKNGVFFERKKRRDESAETS